jgi:hypothetical protein
MVAGHLSTASHIFKATLQALRQRATLSAVYPHRLRMASTQTIAVLDAHELTDGQL